MKREASQDRSHSQYPSPSSASCTSQIDYVSVLMYLPSNLACLEAILFSSVLAMHRSTSGLPLLSCLRKDNHRNQEDQGMVYSLCETICYDKP